MKSTLILLFTILLSFQGFSQIKAVTDTGDEVILYNDGSWTYTNTKDSGENSIPVNESIFVKHPNSSFLVKSSKMNIGVWIDPKVYSFSKVQGDEAQEFQFQLKGEDLYAMLITEKVEIPLETLRGIAIENAKLAAPDIKVVNEEYRTVNGLSVLMMQMEGTIQGIKFTYYGYYYSNENGTLQLLGYTGENLFNSYKDDIEKLINGLVEYE